MKIELIVRYMKPRTLSDDERQDLETKRVIGNDQDFEDIESILDGKSIPIDFLYRPFVLYSEDIVGYTPYDDEHTVLITSTHGELCIKMPYLVWKDLEQYITGENVKIIKEFDTQTQKKKTLKS